MRYFQPRIRFTSFATEGKVEGTIHGGRAEIDVVRVRKGLREGVAVKKLAEVEGVCVKTLSKFIHRKGLSFMLRSNQPHADFSVRKTKSPA